MNRLGGTSVSINDIAASFSRAAHDYDRYAKVQARIARDALAILPVSVSGVSLDIGCGPGTHTAALAARSEHAIGIDIAKGMLAQARVQYPQCTFIRGDARALPVADDSVQLLFSSMALQWCESPRQVLMECQRVLKPHGEAVLAIMTEGSLWQLREAQRAAGVPVTLNPLPSAEQWWRAAQRLSLCVSYETRCYEDVHPDFSSLLHSIGKIGAAVQTHQRTRLTKQGLLKLRHCYQRWGATKGRWPISYQVFFLRLQG